MLFDNKKEDEVNINHIASVKKTMGNNFTHRGHIGNVE
jgi:hypothetical protein